jgi:uncharacterized protein
VSGCTDTDDNAADFTAGAPAPRNTSSPFNPCGAPVGPILVISQVYGGGGNSGAPYRNDFVEVFNRGDAPASLAGSEHPVHVGDGGGQLRRERRGC